MGRQIDLERLALGRSAFQDIGTDGEALEEKPAHATGPTAEDQRDGGDGYQQQYDSKGRPINPATQAQNQAMRNAQNAVLKIVGVVESKETSNHQLKTQYLSKQQAREKLLKAEHARGKDLGFLTSLVHVAITWWPETLTSRIQAGVHAESMSFADIILRDFATAQLGGIKAFFGTFFAGAPLTLVIGVLKLLLCGTTIQAFGRLQKWLNRRLQASRFKWVNHGLLATSLLCIVAIESAFIPMQYLATTQKLGLAPSRPVVGGWKELLPWNTFFMQPFIWKSAVNLPFASVLSSPAALIWLQTVLISVQGESVLSVSKLATFKYLLGTERQSDVTRPNLDQGPFRRLLDHGNPLRAQILRQVLNWFGWNIEYVEERRRLGHEYENNYSPCQPSPSNHDPGQSSTNNQDNEVQRVYRSTSMSQLPAQYLADLMDELYSRLRTLPLDSFVLRTIAFSFLASSLPRTSQAVSAAKHTYSPFGGGPLGTFRAHGFSAEARYQLGCYMSKLCLSLALQCTAEIGVFFAVYKLARWEGIRNFGWVSSKPSNEGATSMNIDESAG